MAGHTRMVTLVVRTCGLPPTMVMKVKQKSMKIRRTLPPDSQNSYNDSVSEYKLAETLSETVAVLKQHHQDLCYVRADTSAQERDWTKMGPFIAAMYVTTAREVSNALAANNEMKVVGGHQQPARQSSYANMPFMTFPWIFAKELGLIARRRSPTSATVTHSTLSLRKPAPKPLFAGLDYVPPPLPEIHIAGGVIHEGGLLEVHGRDELPLHAVCRSVESGAEAAITTSLEGDELSAAMMEEKQTSTDDHTEVQLSSNSAGAMKQEVCGPGVSAGHTVDENAAPVDADKLIHEVTLLRMATLPQPPTKGQLAAAETEEDDADDEMEEEVIIAPSTQLSALDALQKMIGA